MESTPHPRLAQTLAAMLIAAVAAPLHGADKPAKPAPPMTTYELVLQERPEPVAGFFLQTRENYDRCVAEAGRRHRPVKPFPAIAPDFLISRSTLIVDGASRLVKEERLWSLDESGLTPELGCEFRLAPDPGYSLHIDRSGTFIAMDLGSAGKIENYSDERDAARYESRAATAEPAAYTERREMNGIRMRCLPKGSAALAETGASELCVYEQPTALRYPGGQAVTIYMRSQPTQDDRPLPFQVVTEPVTLRPLQSIDPAVFRVNTYAR